MCYNEDEYVIHVSIYYFTLINVVVHRLYETCPGKVEVLLYIMKRSSIICSQNYNCFLYFVLNLLTRLDSFFPVFFPPKTSFRCRYEICFENCFGFFILTSTWVIISTNESLKLIRQNKTLLLAIQIALATHI